MSSTRHTLREGQILFKEGSFSDCAYIIESGALEVLKKDDQDREFPVALLKRNDIVGEMGLIDGMPRSATVRAKRETCVTVITREQFDTLSKKNPNALMPIMKVLAKRLRDSLTKMVDSPDAGYLRKASKIGQKASLAV